MPSNTKKIGFKNISWTNIVNPKELDMEKLREDFEFHPLDLQECLRRSHRSEIDFYDNYIFLVLLFPIYNRKTREITVGEIKFFISKQNLITIHHREFPTFDEFFKLFELSPALRSKFNDPSPERLLYEILNKFFLYCFPMIDHLIVDCDTIERAIFSGQERQMVSEILIIRRNITDFRKIMQVHKNALKKLIFHLKESPNYFMKKTDIYFENLIDYTKEIWDTLDNLKERIEALQDTNESQISFKMSDVMKTLTIISVLTFPLTLIATIFSMDVMGGMPFIRSGNGFWIIISIMALTVVGMIGLFKRKGWF